MAPVFVHPHHARWGVLVVVLCLCGLFVAVGAQPVAAAPTCTTDCYVDVALGNDANSGTAPGAGNALQTIQAAVNQVNVGGTVHVAAGTYPESVAVNKSVIIDGDGPATTIIDPVTFVNISAGDVTIQDLTIQNGGTHGATITGAAALSNITFDNVHFMNNPNRGLEIGLTGILTNLQVLNSLFDGNTTGIRIFSGGRVEGLTIDNTTFQNHPHTSSGIGFYQANDGNNGYVKDLHVDNSTFTGNGFSGIYVEEAVNAEIENSDFSGNSRGVMVFDWFDSAPVVTDDVNIHNNTFTDNTAASIMVIGGNENGLGGDVDVNLNTFNQDVSAFALNWAVIDVRLQNGFTHGTVDVTNNQITFSGTYGTATATYGVKIRGGVDAVNVTDNTIDGGSVGTNGGTPPTAGVYLATNVASTYGATKAASVVTVTANLINNFPIGVVVYDEVAAAYGGLPAGATLDVNRNDLSANSAYGFQSGPSTASDGTCNWWGATDGPSGEGGGAGTAVSTDVTFSPWLYSNNLDSDCYEGGRIYIEKVAVGGELVDFTFDVSWSNDNVVIKGGESYVTDPPLPAGSGYSISEINLPVGWSLQSATCEGPDNVTADPSDLQVFDGFSWTCTFTNVYTPPSTCPATGPASYWTDILGIGMGNPKKHKTTAKLVIPNWDDVSSLYGQLVAKNVGNANYVRFMSPGVNNYLQVNTITSPPAHAGGNFWYGAFLEPAPNMRGRWFLQPNGAKNHIPRAFVLYPTYADPVNTYVNVWDTFDAADSEVDYNVAAGWVAYHEIVVPITPNRAATTFHVELALTDNDKDAREVWVTVTAGGVSQTVKPKNPNKGDQLNILEFDLVGVAAGTDEIVIEVYSPSPVLDGVTGDSAMLVGMAAHYQCLAIID